jgi:NADP-dependent 3-hydroxy acid dehydrogenase YdfG
MYPLSGKIVFITGASSGIGASCARAFADTGARIMICARRKERLEALSEELISINKVEVHAFQLDIRDRYAVESSISNLPDEWKNIEVLINNAGLGRGLDKFHEAVIEDWEEMIDTNIKGLLYVTRAVIPGMVMRGSGHIINIGSIAGREVYPGGSVYCSTKFAVRALSQGMRLDLMGTPIRVTNIEPGMVKTEFSIVRFRGDRERADRVYEGMKALTPEDIADAVVYAATRPPHVNVVEMLITPTAQVTTTMTYRKK